jgi:peroxiredoxin
MAQGDLNTCRIKIGQDMPDGELAGLDGKRVHLQSLLGKRLTVVLFWPVKSIYASEHLENLDQEFRRPYSAKGVAVVSIAEGGAADAVKKKMKAAAADLPVLVDADGTYFAKVATERVPRTYLLDAEGKVLWLDVEFSRSTRRDLKQAIDGALGGA